MREPIICASAFYVQFSHLHRRNQKSGTSHISQTLLYDVQHTHLNVEGGWKSHGDEESSSKEAGQEEEVVGAS